VLLRYYPGGEPGRWGASLAEAFGIEVASQQIDHRRGHDDAANGAIDRATP
jgi:hypothetical protein